MTGKEKWRLEDGRTLAAHGASGDVVLTSRKQLTVVEHDTGKVVDSIEVAGILKAVANSVSDSVFLLGQGGRVLCVRLDDVPYLRRQQVSAAREQLNQPPAQPRKPDPALQPIPREHDPLEDDPLRSKRDVP
jgi:hypothetical protein